MRNAKPTIPLYVRLEAELDTAMREAVRASPGKYSTVADFVRDSIENQLKKERRQWKQEQKADFNSGII